MDFIEDHAAVLGWLTLIGVVTFVATLVAIPLLVARIPHDYFVRRPVRDWPTGNPTVHLLLVAGKNLLGLLLLAAGLMMLVLPGQGMLTIFIGMLLLDFPGKRRLERRLIRIRPILAAADWMRTKRGRPPLQVPGRRRRGR